ncbi:hypothetical protein HKX48_005303 [Thoreauomyces humboldtii]|nr:hypothetical protein HKX48_005303 [Thoreauomyces humboldtii]
MPLVKRVAGGPRTVPSVGLYGLDKSQANLKVHPRVRRMQACAKYKGLMMELKLTRILLSHKSCIDQHVPRSSLLASSYWTYTAALKDVSAWSKFKHVYLVFDGLDTPTNISLFGKHIGETANQFRQFYFDVTDVVTEPAGSDRNLTIASKALTVVPVLSHVFLARANITELGYNRQYIRKIQSDFGWDWGPGFAPIGVWQPGYIVGLDPVHPTKQAIEVTELNTFVDIYKEGQIPGLVPDQSSDWIVNVSVSLVSAVKLEKATMQLCLPDLRYTSPDLPLDVIHVGQNYAQAHVKIPKSLPKLWWTWDLGYPQLYNLTIEINPASSAVAPLKLTKSVGFRTILLNLLPVPKDQTIGDGGKLTPGTAFHFELNGVTFYVKGSNWIPADAFPSRVTVDKLQKLLISAQNANMNMLRLWGRGRYESDDLYSIADRMGILLWSEAIFGNTLYPVDSSFVDNVIPEIEENVRRISHHPSLACWVGNNEQEVFDNTHLLYSKHYLHEYNWFYVILFQNVFLSVMRSITYVHSSTTTGWLSGPDPWIARYNNATPGELYGDTEGWNYNVQLDIQTYNISAYTVSRLVNEFGFHSMPSVYSWDEVLKFPEDYHFNGSVVQARNHKFPPIPAEGLRQRFQLTGQTTFHFPSLPEPELTARHGRDDSTRNVVSKFPTPTNPDVRANFSTWCHATQLGQATLMESEIEYYRYGAGNPNNNLGSIIWQLNDIWQAPTWASIEYDLRWKVVHYHLKRVYKPVISTAIYNSTSDVLHVYATSDLQHTTSGTATLEYFTWSGRRVGAPQHRQFTVSSLSNALLWTLGGDRLSAPGGHGRSDTWLRIRLSAGGGKYHHENYYTSSNLKTARLDTDVTLDVRPGSSGSDSIVVAVEGGAAAFFWVDHPACVTGHFDDNSIFLVPGESRTLHFDAWTNECTEDWRTQVVVRTVNGYVKK